MSRRSILDFLALFVPADANGFIELRAKTQPGPRDFIRLSQADAVSRVLAYIDARTSELRSVQPKPTARRRISRI